MKAIDFMRMLSGVAVVSAIVFGGVPATASVQELTKKVAGFTVHYKVVLPDGYDATKTYPAIIALGGGPQTMNSVDGTLNRNFRAEAEKRGYIVVGVAAPDGNLFFEDGARIFPEFLKMILSDYKIRDGKFHIAGPSNGGIASFHVAAANPQYFLSVTAFPGYHVGADAGQASSDLEDVRLHVCRRKRRVPLARRDATRGGGPAREGNRRALHRREGAAAPDGDACRRERRPALRRLRGDQEGLRQVT